MAGLQSGEGHTMIDSVVLAQYINVTDTQVATQLHSHVATTTAALTQCVRAAKTTHRSEVM